MLKLDVDSEGIRASMPVPLAEVADIEEASATDMHLDREQDGSCINKTDRLPWIRVQLPPGSLNGGQDITRCHATAGVITNFGLRWPQNQLSRGDLQPIRYVSSYGGTSTGRYFK